jgi:hypothetical protein
MKKVRIRYPATSKIGAVDFEKRARKNSASAMPISFAKILKQSKKR